MANRVPIQNKIQKGRGKAAQRVGQPYGCYRLPDDAAGNWLHQDHLIAENVPVFFHGTVSPEFMQGPNSLGILWWNLIVDLRRFQTGDVLILDDPIINAGRNSVPWETGEFTGIAVAFDGPVKRAVGARLNTLAQVYRPSATPDAGGYFSPTRDNGRPVVLADGSFSLSDDLEDPACLLPVGIVAETSLRRDNYIQVPSITKLSQWTCYVPPMQGFAFREGDRLIRQDGSRYVVQMAYSQDVGTVGSQLVIEKEIGQADG